MDSPVILRFERPGLRRWERNGLILLAVALTAFAVLAEIRACYQRTRKTDFGVYLRAAYAVRSGGDIYQATDDNGYHYTYPPAFAVIMTPFADAPAGVDRDGLLPYPLSVAIWTLFNFVLLARTAHTMASLALPNERHGSRRWWYARMVPFYAASGGLLYSIGFGQVNMVLVAMLVEIWKCSVTGFSRRSGLWLAAAITLKVIPAYLLLYPFLNRSFRLAATRRGALGECIQGVAIGLILGLGVIPLAGLGIEGSVAAYRSFANRVLLPGALGNSDPGHLRELHHMALNDNQSFLAVIHQNLHPVNTPAAASGSTRWIHNSIVAILTLVVIGLARRSASRTLQTIDDLRLLGVLMLVMLHATPMSHMHYYAFGYVAAAAWYFTAMTRTAGLPSWRMCWPIVLWGVGTALPLLPGGPFEFLRHRGLGPACSMLLLGLSLSQFRTKSMEQEQSQPVRKAA